MIPPINCPYKMLTAPPCWNCNYYDADCDQCSLASLTTYATNNTIWRNQTFEEQMQDYEKQRQELMKLSKEALVNLIIKRPSYF